MARRSAEERREEIVEIAFRHFAAGGYHGTSTEAIAREAGISQPYLFRLFKTKRDLFIACVDRCFEQVMQVFAESRIGADEPWEASLGRAYEERLLPDRHALLFQMQAYSTSEPVIHAHVRAGWLQLRERVAALVGVPLDETWDFFSYGMLLNVLTALDIEWMPPH